MATANAGLEIANADNALQAEEILALREQLAAVTASLAECQTAPGPEPEPEPEPEPGI